MATWVQRLVWRFPVLGDAAATYRGWQLKRIRYGPQYAALVEEISARRAWSPEQMQRYVDERLRAMVAIAAEHVPHYREAFATHGVRPEDVRGATDLARLPLLAKETVRAAPERLLNTALPRARLHRSCTSGTTGTPVALYYTSEVAQWNYAFFEARHRRVIGMEFGRRPYAMLGAQPVTAATRTRPPFWVYNYASKQLYLSSYHLAERYLDHYVKALRQRPYHALMGFPSSLHALAQYMLAHGERVRIPIISTSSEMLYEHQRADIERAFEGRVFDQYGCAEKACFASQEADGVYYISPDYGILEVLDEAGQPVAPGETGELVCTSLCNDAQLFLRYRLGDRGAILPPLPGGPPFPRLARLEGRIGQAILTPDGREVARLGPVLSGLAGIRECQFVQEERDLVRVLIVPAPDFVPAAATTIVARLRERCGEMRIEVTRVDAIPRTQGGKFETVVRKWQPEVP